MEKNVRMEKRVGSAYGTPVFMLFFDLKRWMILLPATVWAAGFAPDQRHLAPNRAPFTALARTHAHGGVGCGALIGPDLLLTCAHCISNPQFQVYDDVEIEFGVGFEPVSRTALLKEAIVSKSTDASIEGGQDWAIVRLDRPLGAYYGWLDCRYLTDSEWRDQEVELLGYCSCPDEARPQFGQMDRPYRCTGAVSDVGSDILFHNCAMWGGTSGAPLLAKTGTDYKVVGVNFAAVDLAGEALSHGFRDTYKKEWANLAIPARQWRTALTALPPSRNPILRTVWVHNATQRPLTVRTNYRSIFSAPDSPPSEVMAQVAPGYRHRLLSRQSGCFDEELTFQVSERKALTRRLNSGETEIVIR